MLQEWYIYRHLKNQQKYIVTNFWKNKVILFNLETLERKIEVDDWSGIISFHQYLSEKYISLDKDSLEDQVLRHIYDSSWYDRVTTYNDLLYSDFITFKVQKNELQRIIKTLKERELTITTYAIYEEGGYAGRGFLSNI